MKHLPTAIGITFGLFIGPFLLGASASCDRAPASPVEAAPPRRAAIRVAAEQCGHLCGDTGVVAVMSNRTGGRRMDSSRSFALACECGAPIYPNRTEAHDD